MATARTARDAKPRERVLTHEPNRLRRSRVVEHRPQCQHGAVAATARQPLSHNVVVNRVDPPRAIALDKRTGAFAVVDVGGVLRPGEQRIGCPALPRTRRAWSRSSAAPANAPVPALAPAWLRPSSRTCPARRAHATHSRCDRAPDRGLALANGRTAASSRSRRSPPPLRRPRDRRRWTKPPCAPPPRDRRHAFGHEPVDRGEAHAHDLPPARCARHTARVTPTKSGWVRFGCCPHGY
jgi:hypothetical protein